MPCLASFLRRAAAEPFRLGEWDCAMTLANWVREATGIDPAADLRGHYRTEFGWRRIVRREGGLVALVGRLAAAASMVPTERPAWGDIGVVESAAGPAGAIRVDGRWVAKMAAGVTAGDAPFLAAWSLP